MTEEQTCKCGAPKSAHVLYIVTEPFIDRREYDVERGPLCPGQLEDIDTFETGEEDGSEA